jgi:uncharacterized membrane protein YedE/YeeE
MAINWESFTPTTALEGGLIIGLAVAILLLVNGRIAGISGIFGGLLNFQTKDRAWRIVFLLGLVISPLIWSHFAELPTPVIESNKYLIELSGFLVGLGTRFAGGCTSGHGVCGLSRLSLRSLVATGLFIFSGVVTVYVTHHLLGQ